MSLSRLRPVFCIAACAMAMFLGRPLPAVADEAEASGVGRSYAGISFSYGFENFDDDNGVSDVDDAVGLNAWMGYRVAEYWSIETQIEYLFGFDLTVADMRNDGQYVAVTLNAKVYPFARLLPSEIEPFLYAGLGGGRIQVNVGGVEDVEEIAVLSRFGAGVDFYVTDHVAIQLAASYVQPTQDLNNFSYISTLAGIQYRF